MRLNAHGSPPVLPSFVVDVVDVVDVVEVVEVVEDENVIYKTMPKS